jgi:hypothetical protein
MHEPGSFVTHTKLPELGSGEIVSYDRGAVRIRFASGERQFLLEAAAPHLLVSDEAPARPSAPKRASGTKRKTKAKA